MSSVEKFIGESQLKSTPTKKFTFIIDDKKVTTAKIADNAITEEKISGEDTPEGAAVTTSKIKDGAVTNPKIANGAVTTIKIQDFDAESSFPTGVTNEKLADESVTESKLASGAVTEGKIAPNAVTAGKIADDAVIAGNIADGAISHENLTESCVQAGNIAPNAVENDNIANNAVTSGKIAANAVTTEKLSGYIDDQGVTHDAAVTNAKIANNAVTTAKIGDGEVQENHLAPGAVTTAKLADGMIEQLQTITDAVPTEGSVKPVQSGGVEKYKVTVAVGKNLLNKDKCIKDKYINRSTGAVASLSGAYATDFIPVSEDGLVCSVYYEGGSVIGAAVYNTNKVYLRRCPNPYVYQEGDGYVRYTIQNSDTLVVAQVEVGSKSTQFQPYSVIGSYLNENRSYRYVIQSMISRAADANIFERSLKTVFIDPDLLVVTKITITYNSYVLNIYVVNENITSWKSLFRRDIRNLRNGRRYALVNSGETVGYIVFKDVSLLSELSTLPTYGLVCLDVNIVNNRLYDTTLCVSDIYNENLSPVAVDVSKIKPNEVLRAKVGKNIANPEDFRLGYYTRTDDGSQQAGSGYCITGYLPASENGLVCNHPNITDVSGGGVYDAKLRYIRPITNPYIYQEGDAFVTFDFLTTYKNVLQVEEGNTSTSFEKYNPFAGLLDVITVDNITFKTQEAGKNKVNPDDIELNKYINRDNGISVSWSGLDVTGYIPVSKKGLVCNYAYYGGSVIGSAVYDSNKAYKRALYSQYVYQDGDGYVRFTFSHDNIARIQVEEGSVSTAYEPYESRTVLLPELIPTIGGGGGGEDEKENIISLPKKIYAVVGDTLQIFFSGIIMSVDALKYNINISCSKGTVYHRCFQYTPNATDVGTTSFIVTVRDDYGNTINTKSCQLVTVNILSSPSSQTNVLCIGDSLTAGGQWPSEAYRRLTASGGTPEGKELTNISFVGSMTKNGAGYEGHSGWAWSDYTTAGRSSSSFRFYLTSGTAAIGDVYSNNGHNYTVNELQIIDGVSTILCSASSSSDTPSASGTLTKVSGTGDSTLTYSSASHDSANPFWDSVNNKMTFIPFVNTYCNGDIDVIYILLGGNGLAKWKEDFSDTLGHVKTFADTLHSEYPNCKLMLMNMQFPSMKLMMPGYGASGNYSDTYGILVSLFRQNQAYQEFANDDDYKDWVEFVNLSSQFDSDYNYPITQKDVNTRNSSEKDSYANNTLHPANSGYYQYADVVYRNFVANFCQ